MHTNCSEFDWKFLNAVVLRRSLKRRWHTLTTATPCQGCFSCFYYNAKKEAKREESLHNHWMCVSMINQEVWCRQVMLSQSLKVQQTVRTSDRLDVKIKRYYAAFCCQVSCLERRKKQILDKIAWLGLRHAFNIKMLGVRSRVKLRGLLFFSSIKGHVT